MTLIPKLISRAKARILPRVAANDVRASGRLDCVLDARARFLGARGQAAVSRDERNQRILRWIDRMTEPERQALVAAVEGLGLRFSDLIRDLSAAGFGASSKAG